MVFTSHYGPVTTYRIEEALQALYPLRGEPNLEDQCGASSSYPSDRDLRGCAYDGATQRLFNNHGVAADHVDNTKPSTPRT